MIQRVLTQATSEEEDSVESYALVDGPYYLEIWKLTSFWEFPCILYVLDTLDHLVVDSVGEFFSI